eukprot:10573428-Alexandrium_andersonii.AAC.1
MARDPSDEVIHRMLDEQRDLRRTIDQLQNELALSRSAAAAAPPDAGGGPPAEAGGGPSPLDSMIERLEKMEALLRRDQAGSASAPALPGPALERASALSGEDGANKEVKDAQML